MLQSDVDSSHYITVTAKKIDDILAPKLVNASKPLILKIDIEGHEFEALKGANQTIKYVDIIFIEANSLTNIDQKEKIVELLSENGFQGAFQCNYNQKSLSEYASSHEDQIYCSDWALKYIKEIGFNFHNHSK